MPQGDLLPGIPIDAVIDDGFGDWEPLNLLHQLGL